MHRDDALLCRQFFPPKTRVFFRRLLHGHARDVPSSPAGVAMGLAFDVETHSTSVDVRSA
jgi:hypothetical protein